MPEHILKRPKSKFSDGAGSINFLAEYANQKITDGEFLQNESKASDFGLRSKEELFYFQVFEGIFGLTLSSQIEGRTLAITIPELQ